MATPRRALLLVALGVAVAACSAVQPIASKTFTPGSEPGFAVGSLHLVGDPALAAMELHLTYVGPDGAVARINDDFGRGAPVLVDRTFEVGSHTLRVNGATCGTFEIVSDSTTNVTLQATPEACLLSAGELGPSASAPAQLGVVNGLGPRDTLVHLLPRGWAGEGRQTMSDESGSFTFDRVVPGSYRVVLATPDGATQDIEVPPDGTVQVEFP